MRVCAFLDESGEPNLDVAGGGSTHFVIGAVVVPEGELHARRSAVEGVRRKHFQTGPIKSKTVGGNSTRRHSILEDLATTGYRFLALVIDKRAIYGDSGLQYRRSFVKFLSRFMYDRLFRAYPELEIRADSVGRPEFMESFRAYLAKHWAQVDLFSTPPTVEFVKATDDVMIQAADFVAGSLRIAYGDDISDANASAILSRLRPASLGIHEWPVVARTAAVVPSGTEAADLDHVVRAAADRSVYTFLAASKDDEGEARLQVEVLQDLLHAARFEESPFVSGDALAERMRERGFRDCSRDQIRRSVIAPLRDHEVLVVSSARGYGLPRGIADMETHIHRMEEEVRPILRRVQTMDELLRRASVGKVEVLVAERLAYLRALLATHQSLEAAGGTVPRNTGGAS